MKLVARSAETDELKRCERSGKSELVCVYGRRRVGKTYLVEQTFSGSFAFRATGVEGGNMRQQLKSFNQRLQEHGDPQRTIPKNWFEAFSRLDIVLSREDAARSPYGKKVVFLDEFPWFATARSEFLMAFGEFWNRRGTAGDDIMVVICGSATSWIVGNVLENTGSLYNRVTSQVYLEPFCLGDAERFFVDRGFGWTRSQIAESHMVFGGLPYFLELLDPNESLRANIERLCFAPHALLAHESSKLLEATLKKSPAYDRLLSYLAKHRCGVEKQACFEQTGLAKGTFARAVDDLLKCGYIREFKVPTKRGKPLFLQLVDPFLLFHYRFLSKKSGDRVGSWSDCIQDEARYKSWRGCSFEILCVLHEAQIKRALGISGVRTRCYPWTSDQGAGGAQIDLVIERDDGIINICEMRCTDRPFSMDAATEASLLNKVDVFKRETGAKNPVKIVVVSASGIAGVAHTEYISRTITLDDLFAAGS